MDENLESPESLKRRAYLEGSTLKNTGYDNEVIHARLEKQGIPEELAKEVIHNLNIQQRKDVIKEQEPFYNIALIRIGIGVALAIISFVALPGQIILPIGLIFGGIAAAYIAKSKMKG